MQPHTLRAQRRFALPTPRSAILATALTLVALLACVRPAAAADAAAARAAAPTRAPTPTLAIVGARILPSPEAPAIADGVVVVRDGTIAAVGPRERVRIPRGAARIDGRGTTLVAGFWNSHVHLLHEDVLDARNQPAERLAARLRETFTRHGFTTVFDIGSRLDDALAVRERIESGEIPGPRIYTVGDPFYPEGGTPIYVRELYRKHAFASGEVPTPAAARERALAQLARGANGVKLFTGAIVGPPEGVRPMRVEVAAAAARPALDASLPVFAHATDLRGLSIALDAGVNVIAHTTPTDGPWPPAVTRRVVEQRVALVPTLTLFESELAKDGVPEEVRRRIVGDAQQQVRALLAAGGVVLFGTDVGYIDAADTGMEIRLLAGAGLDARAILKTLTTAPAARFERTPRSGRVAVGMAADLVLLDGDPDATLEALAAVRCTLRAGRIVYGAPDCAASSGNASGFTRREPSSAAHASPATNSGASSTRPTHAAAPASAARRSTSG